MHVREVPLRAATVALGAIGVAGAAWIAIPAEAATLGVVSVSGTVVSYTAAAGKTNTVVVTRSGNTITIDDVYSIKAGTGCRAVSGNPTIVKCTVAGGGPRWVRVDAGDLNDTVINNADVRSTIWGRAGNDKITGGASSDNLYGGAGNDAIWGRGLDDNLYGEAGADALSGGDSTDEYGLDGDYLYGGAAGDRLLGGNGTDILVGGPGNDVEDGGAGTDIFQENYDYAAGTDADAFVGGADFDWVDYSDRKRNVTADADAISGDDGAAGEKDTIGASVEGIEGGFGNDKLLGTPRVDALRGGPGNDAIAAGSGDDWLFGEEGVDFLNGAGGNDTCSVAQAGETLLSCEVQDPELSILAKQDASEHDDIDEAFGKWLVENR